jgi:hypothetical protein
MKNKMPVIKEGCTDGVGALHCPRCGNDSLHHVGVYSWFRDDEDQMATIIKSSRQKCDLSRGEPEGCSSMRRDGLVIRFYCEHHSDDVMELEIVQHKGSTFINWIDLQCPYIAQ